MENKETDGKEKTESREGLKKFFEKNSLPTQENFEILIDSMFNKKDDYISINKEDGLKVYPTEDHKKFLSLYKTKNTDDASWIIVLENENNGLAIKEKISDEARIYFGEGGNVGIGTVDPKQKFEVKGNIAFEGKVGTFAKGKVKADSEWKKILSKEQLVGINAFEIMAQADGKIGEKVAFALMHAIVLTKSGKSGSKIFKTCTHFGYWWEFWNKINLRFREGALEIRTYRNYGDEADITFRVLKLWDNSFLKNI